MLQVSTDLLIELDDMLQNSTHLVIELDDILQISTDLLILTVHNLFIYMT